MNSALERLCKDLSEMCTITISQDVMSRWVNTQIRAAKSMWGDAIPH